jgi:hypothetical protein
MCAAFGQRPRAPQYVERAPQLTSAAIQEWEVKAVVGRLKAGTAPGEGRAVTRPACGGSGGAADATGDNGSVQQVLKSGVSAGSMGEIACPHAAQTGQQARVH